MEELNERQSRIVNMAHTYLGDKFWTDRKGDLLSAFTCAHLVLHVYYDAGELKKYPSISALFAKAYTDSLRGVTTPFANGVDEYFDRKSAEDILPGDFVLFIYKESFRAHAGVYIGDGNYIDTNPDRGYVAITTLDQMIADAADDYQYYIVYDGLSCKK